MKLAVDRFAGNRPHEAPAELRPFVEATVLASADVHLAQLLTRTDDPTVDVGLRRLGAAMAVRAIRLGHTCVNLDSIASTASPDDEVEADLVTALDWPATVEWVAAMSSWDKVADGDGAGPGHPLRLVGSRLYLDRYWRAERFIARDLDRRSRAEIPGVDADLLTEGLARLFEGDAPDLQRIGAAMAVLRPLAVIAGGPGTGKTTTVARLLALVVEQALATGVTPRLALAAPTGKAAARLHEAVHGQLPSLDISDEARQLIETTDASTLHRLLGWQPGNRSRFRHHRGNQLAHDIVVVDETSMVSLSMMASLVEAVRPSARLVLIGDPDQLVSVEAGAVLGDIVGPAATAPRHQAAARATLEDVTAHPLPGDAGDDPIGDCVVVLDKVHRFGGGIDLLARAIRAGDATVAVDVLRSGGIDGDLRWIELDAEVADAPLLVPEIKASIIEATRTLVAAGRAGDAVGAANALGAAQLLCAHRGGPYGVHRWRDAVITWLRDAVGGFVGIRSWYPGQPLLVTENDYSLGLFNGDTGVVVQRGESLVAVFERQGELLEVGPNRLAAVETPLAMTIHKSQGSQFEAVHVVLPDESSPLLTRELVYTAVTRASHAVTLVATQAAVVAAINRPVSRASGLLDRLWTETR